MVDRVNHASVRYRNLFVFQQRMPGNQNVVINSKYAILVGAKIPGTRIFIFEPRFFAVTVVIDGALHGVWVIERRCLKKRGRTFTAINVYAITDMVINFFIEPELIDELPVPPQAAVRRSTQSLGFFIDEVRLRVDQTGDSTGAGVAPGLFHEAAIQVRLQARQMRIDSG